MTDWTPHYIARRHALREAVRGGAVLLLGAPMVPRNYAHNTWPFRQDSTLLYYTGLQLPDMALWIGPDGTEILIADPTSLDDLVWTGPVPSPAELAARAGLAAHGTWAQLAQDIAACDPAGIAIHHLCPTHTSMQLVLARLLHLPVDALAERVSQVLRDAIIEQRLTKEPCELNDIELALGVSDRMHRAVMRQCQPGVRESDLAATIESLALAEGCAQSYHPIVTVHGEILHNHGYGNTLQAGQLLLNDSGAESPLGYASDITRTLPVTGQFEGRQRAIYELVLRAQLHAIGMLHPGMPYREVHDAVSLLFAEGLIDLKLMQGDPHEAVAAGAHAAFFVHGLGHALGLDVHDMEDLGEEAVGYAHGQIRSVDFGTRFLRFARPVKAGHVVTVEPGLYFIPALFDQWQQAGRHTAFIRYDQLEAWRDFGGIRIEDDVVVTDSGSRVLGPGIPKTIDEVEAAMG